MSLNDSETTKTPTLESRLSSMEEQLQKLMLQNEELENKLNSLVAMVARLLSSKLQLNLESTDPQSVYLTAKPKGS